MADAKNRIGKTFADSLIAPIATAAAALLVLAGCSAPSATPVDDGKVHVVASTAVWGSVAQTLGGDYVSVTSIIERPNQDPHSYEATPQDQLAVSKADLVIFTGNGYDDFMRKLIAAAETSANNKKLSTLELNYSMGYGESGDIHVWYGSITREVADLGYRLATLDPAHAAEYIDNMKAFRVELAKLYDSARALFDPAKSTFIATESIPVNLLVDQVRMTDLTPPELTRAVANETDIPPAVMLETTKLLKSGDVALLVFNEQVSSTQSDLLIATAKTAGVPTVGFSENLPVGETYISWMTKNIAAVAAALGHGG
jgi:zinc/manganese transport system substrate-binding protein